MIKKFLVLLCLIILLFCSGSVYAADSGIVCTHTIDGNSVCITGQISDAVSVHQVTLLVGTEDNIIYIAQKASSSEGTFSFAFNLPDDLESGDYEYKVGSNACVGTYCGVLEFTKSVSTEASMFGKVDIDINIVNYTPTITASISCTEGKTLSVNIQNITDSKNIANDIITEPDFVYNMSYKLPNLLTRKEYITSIICTDGEKELFVMNINIKSSILLVTFSGSVVVADGVSINATVKSNESSLVNQSSVIDADKSLSYTLPNVLANASYSLCAECYETIVVEDDYISLFPIVDEYAFSLPQGKAGNELIVVPILKSKNEIDHTYVLTYDPDILEIKSFFGSYYEDCIEACTKGNVEIISYTPGKIQWKVHDVQIPVDKVVSGAINVFKFVYKQDFDDYSTIYFFIDKLI